MNDNVLKESHKFDGKGNQRLFIGFYDPSIGYSDTKPVQTRQELEYIKLHFPHLQGFGYDEDINFKKR